MIDLGTCKHGICESRYCALCDFEIEQHEMLHGNGYTCMAPRSFYEGECAHGQMHTVGCFDCLQDSLESIDREEYPVGPDPETLAYLNKCWDISP